MLFFQKTFIFTENRIMQKSLLALLLFLSAVTFSQELEVILQNPVSENNFRGLWVVDENVVWASGTKGTIIKTTNGGKSWQNLPIKGFEDKDFRDIVAFDEKRAFVINAGSPAYILKTTDGGNNWQIVYQDTSKNAFLNDIGFFGEKIGFVFGDPDNEANFTLLKSEDGGNTWTNIGKNLPKAQKNEAGFAASGTIMRFREPSHIWIGTGGGEKARILLSTDLGNTWQSVEVPILSGKASQGIFSVVFQDLKNGVAVGGDYTQPNFSEKTAIYTSDGGKSWKIAKIPPKGYRSCVSYIRKKTYIAVGSNGIDFSKDGGKKWKNISTEGFHTVRFIREGNIGWAIGNKGKLAKIILK
jgi:photosystem II stability/assembly factor-like uncharacterized protein